MCRDETERRSSREQQQRLREELLCEPAARRAKDRANRDLALARRGARDKQARDVDAGDEQHEADGSEQHEQRTLRLPDCRRAQTLDVDEEIALRVAQLSPTLGISPRQLTRDFRNE